MLTLKTVTGTANYIELPNLVTSNCFVVFRTTNELSEVNRFLQLGQLENAVLLVRNGANISQVENNGDTPLHFAARYGEGSPKIK